MKVIEGLLFLRIDDLVKYGIERSTIHNGISLFRRGKTSKWMHLGEREGSEYFKQPLIAYDCLPSETRKKLPSKNTILKRVLEDAKICQQIMELHNRHDAIIHEMLDRFNKLPAPPITQKLKEV